MKLYDNCGLFGKVPMQSEFISHFLPESFTEQWHSWLQSCLSVSHEQLGDEWLDFYLTSPVWQFAISANVIGPLPVMGIIMPSVDEIGRYFPLTILHQGHHSVWSAYLKGHQWYQNLEAVALTALADDVNYIDWMGKFESLTLPMFNEIRPYQLQSLAYSSTKSYRIAATLSEQALTNALLEDTYQRALGPYSLWWTKGSEHIEPCVLVTSGMPEAGQYAAMLDGKWQQWGWPEQQLPPEEQEP